MWHGILCCISLVALTGCALNKAHEAAPVVDFRDYQATNQGLHVVLKGESLYEIAWRYGRDYKEIAQVNKILPPYRIYPGQKISLKKADRRVGATRTAASNGPSRQQDKKPSLLVEFPEKSKYKKAENLNQDNGKLTEQKLVQTKLSWQWPAQGKIIKKFTLQNPGPKGIDIAGKLGDKVKAAGSGKVVYCGSGLRGYGQLIIIKHNDTYLSAYGHNSHLLVKEGQDISKGQIIAQMGTDGQQYKLHFEIRKHGQPIDPLSILPVKT